MCTCQATNRSNVRRWSKSITPIGYPTRMFYFLCTYSMPCPSFTDSYSLSYIFPNQSLHAHIQVSNSKYTGSSERPFKFFKLWIGNRKVVQCPHKSARLHQFNLDQVNRIIAITISTKTIAAEFKLSDCIFVSTTCRKHLGMLQDKGASDAYYPQERKRSDENGAEVDSETTL